MHFLTMMEAGKRVIVQTEERACTAIACKSMQARVLREELTSSAHNSSRLEKTGKPNQCGNGWLRVEEAFVKER